MNKKIILPLLFLLVGIGCTIYGFIGIKTGNIRGWGEESFIRTTYTAKESKTLFWLYSGGYVAVGSVFTVVSLIALYHQKQ